jgi:valyl-tRNA synthetase
MNKIWNAARFVFMNRGDAKPATDLVPTSELNLWVLHELDQCARRVQEALESYRFNEAASTLYAFIWGTYCDWYVEAAKVHLNGENEGLKHETRVTMLSVLDGWLRLLHPFCPFISEVLWQSLHGEDACLVTESWQDCGHYNGAAFSAAARRMERVQEVVSAIRSMRGEMNVPPGKRILVAIACSGKVRKGLNSQIDLLMHLARLDRIQWLEPDEKVKGAAVMPLDEATIMMPLAGLVDVGEELARLAKERQKLETEVGRNRKKLDNPDFRKKAPDAVIAKVRTDLHSALAKISELEKAEKRLRQL